MAGIYVHIPFCKSRCAYCGFFSTTSLTERGGYVDSVLQELERRKEFLRGETVETVYFGGGTPSQLAASEIGRLLETIHAIYDVRAEAEVTLEGNPDDLTPAYLESLREMGINRLSMGIQTFDDMRLRFLCRRHTARQALQAVQDAQCVGFDNISIDLMFGFPSQTLGQWQADVQQALSLGVQHLSAYSLMYEEGTPLFRMLEAGRVEEVDEEVSRQMYEYLMDALAAAGFEHYEISNFAQPGFRSRHNSSYWRGIPYLGVGAGAHSYDGQNRFYHTDSLSDYMKGIPPVEESLTDDDRYNEFVFTGLRTSDGIRIDELERQYGQQRKEFCLQSAAPHLQAHRMALTDQRLTLTRQGLFISNDIMSDLMIV